MPSTPVTSPAPEKTSADVASRSRWPRRLVRLGGLMVLLGLAVWFAPALVARTALVDYAAMWIFDGIDGTISTRHASLAWFTPVVLEGVTLDDPSGQTAMQVARLESEKTLLDLVLTPREPGRFRCIETTFDISFSDKTSNLETIVFPWLTGGDDTSLEGTALQVEMPHASATITDEASGRSWEVPELAVSLETPRHWSQPMRLAFQSRIEDGDLPAQIELDLQLRYTPSKGGALAPHVEGRLTAADFPLPLATPIVRRLAPALEIEGLATGEWRARWGDSTGASSASEIEGSFATKNLLVSGLPSGAQISGQGSLTAKAQLSAEVISADLNANLMRYVVERPRQPGQGGVGSEEPSPSPAAVERFSGEQLAAEMKVSVTDPAGEPHLDLTGVVRSDLYVLLATLFPEVTGHVRIDGADVATFHYRGPLAALADITGQDTTNASDAPPAGPSPSLEGVDARAELAWTSAAGYGFTLGPAVLRAVVVDGDVRFDPIRTTVGDGRIDLAPTLDLDSGSMVFGARPGSRIERLHLSPELCDQGLKYIAPVLAGVTRAEGLVSLELSHCRVPADSPSDALLDGSFLVHNVRFTGSPLLNNLATVLRLPATARLTENSTVRFRMAGRRVEHQGLQLAIGNVIVDFNGSVGLDHTLELTAEIPLTSQLLGNVPNYLKLDRQTVRIPITGTLEKPVLDRAALRQDLAETLGNTAENALKGELDRQLKKLFGR